ncbi:MAG: hypothetical protein AAFU85_04895 [Planctomycetota bacterium]
MIKSLSMGLLASVALLTVGCNVEVNVNTPSASLDTTTPSEKPISEALLALVLDSTPEGDVHSPTDVKDAEGEAVEGVFAGRIDAGDIDPFQPGQTSFMLSQLPDEGHSDDPEHADNCPFCARKLKNAPKAMVTFLGDDGAAIQGDAQQDLGLKKGDVVLVVGSASYNSDLNTVLVEADNFFLKTSD